MTLRLPLIACFASAASLFTASVLADTPPPPPPAPAPATLEPVTVAKITQPYAAGAFTPSLLEINVATGGCTTAADFRIVVTQRGASQTLRLDRLRKDTCELDAPRGTRLDLSTTALIPGKPIVLENPLFVGRAS
ncbi:hypothetical protein BH09MYX1_BH09MYX1_65260 [soil metagenome]